MLALPRRLLWVLLIGVALALIIMIARHDQEPFSRLASGDLGDLAYHLALVVFVGGAVLMMFRERPSAALEAALFWVVVGFVLVFAYTYRGDLRGVGERVMAALPPLSEPAPSIQPAQEPESNGGKSKRSLLNKMRG